MPKLGKTITFKCSGCGCDKEVKEYYYNKLFKRNNGTLYCSRACFYKYRKKSNGSSLVEYWNKLSEEERIERNKKIGLERRDEYSRFRRFMNYINKSHISRNLEKPDVSLEYLKNLWDQQEGKCAITNIAMDIYETSFHGNNPNKKLTYASVDRIDPNKGYTRGNIQFVCMGINFAKMSYSQEEIKDFINKIFQSYEQSIK